MRVVCPVCRSWRSLVQRTENGISDRLLFNTQSPVCIPEHLNTNANQKLLTLAITRELISKRVSRAVEFNRQSCLFAKEVDVVRSNRMLAPEFLTVKPSVAKPTPHQLFCPRCFPSQNACPRDLGHMPRPLSLFTEKSPNTRPNL